MAHHDVPESLQSFRLPLPASGFKFDGTTVLVPATRQWQLEVADSTTSSR